MDNFFFLFHPNHQQKPSFCFTHPFPAAPNLHLMERFLYLPFPETFQTQYSTQIEIDNSGPPATSGALVQSQTTEGRREGERSSSSRKNKIENIMILSAKKNS